MTKDILLCAIGVPQASSLAPELEARAATVRLVTSVEDAVGAVRACSPDAIVLCVSGGAQGRLIKDWSLEEWMRAADDPIFDLLVVLQQLKSAMAGRTIPILLIGPDLGQTGAGGHTAQAAAAEGQRGLMKTLARQWGPEIRFAWAGVWPPLLCPEMDVAQLPEQPELGTFTPPLGPRPGWREVAAAVLGLITLSEATTGQSVIVDGGEWMLP